MIKKILSFIILSIIIQTESLGQDFQWVRQIKGIVSDYNDFAIGLAVDSNENSYLIGDTESPLFDMDPTIDGVEIIDNSHVENFQGTYLIKVDSDGNYIWGMTFGNYRRSDHAYDIKIGKDGNIYALLSIHEYNSSTNVIDSFIKIVKISPDGNIISTKSIPQVYGNNRTDILYTRSFDLDDQNNVLKEWKYKDAVGANAAMTIPVKEILELQQNNPKAVLDLYYFSSKYLPKGRMLASIKTQEKNTVMKSGRIWSKDGFAATNIAVKNFLLWRI